MSTEPPIDPAAFAAELQQKNKERVYDQRAKLRSLLAAGHYGSASAYAKAHSLDISEFKPEFLPPTPAQLPAWVHEKTPAPVAGPASPAATAVAAPTPASEIPILMNGWPVTAMATVTNSCRNKRLILIQLDGDGDRHAAMWTTGRRWRAGVRVKVQLDSDQARGDPRYLPMDYEPQ